MKHLIFLMVMGSLTAQNFNDSEIYTSYDLKSQYPKEKVPFELSYYDIQKKVHDVNFEGGKISVEFEINELGEVENPVIVDTFNLSLNDVILDKVRQSKYYPALQNGRPVKVKYTLPITFK